jgi:hypothetical protein
MRRVPGLMVGIGDFDNHTLEMRPMVADGCIVHLARGLRLVAPARSCAPPQVVVEQPSSHRAEEEGIPYVPLERDPLTEKIVGELRTVLDGAAYHHPRINVGRRFIECMTNAVKQIEAYLSEHNP